VVDDAQFAGKGEWFNASIQALYPDGRITPSSPEIRFPLTSAGAHALEIPNDFKAKILWANVTAWVRRNL
jgi:hypothetical protein